MRARCHKNGGTCSYFTDGKVYDVRTPGISGHIADVTDDHHHGRVIPIDGGKCAHIVRGYGTMSDEAVGTWELLPDADEPLAMRDCRAWDTLAESLGVTIGANGYVRDGRDAVGYPRPPGPSRIASANCRSGRHDYCSCDTCY